MARCKYCGMNNLEWVEENGRYRMYDPVTGTMHNCHPTRDQVNKVKQAGKACKHGIAMDHWCDQCAEDRGLV